MTPDQLRNQNEIEAYNKNPISSKALEPSRGYRKIEGEEERQIVQILGPWKLGKTFVLDDVIDLHTKAHPDSPHPTRRSLSFWLRTTCLAAMTGETGVWRRTSVEHEEKLKDERVKRQHQRALENAEREVLKYRKLLGLPEIVYAKPSTEFGASAGTKPQGPDPETNKLPPGLTEPTDRWITTVTPNCVAHFKLVDPEGDLVSSMTGPAGWVLDSLLAIQVEEENA